MKILHCSDLHLGKKPFGTDKFSEIRYYDYFKAFDYIAEFAIMNNIDLILIAGDIFDKKEISPDTLEKTEAILYKLKNNGIKILFTEGNHDNIIWGKELSSWLIYLENRGYLKRLTYDICIDETEEENKRIYSFKKLVIDDINFYGLGYPGFKVDEVLLELSKRLDPAQKNIILVHTAISNNDLFPGTVKKATIDKLKDKTIYIAGGHLHYFSVYPSNNPYFFVPGSPEYWNIYNEINQVKGFIVFDTDTLEYKFYHSKKRNIVYKKIDFDILDMEEFDNKLNDFIDKIRIIDEDLVFFEIYLKNNIFVNIKKYRDRIKEQGALECYIKIHYNTEDNFHLNDNMAISVDKIEKNIISDWQFFGKYADFIGDNLKLLKYYQKSNLKENFIEQFDKMLNELLKDYADK